MLLGLPPKMVSPFKEARLIRPSTHAKAVLFAIICLIVTLPVPDAQAQKKRKWGSVDFRLAEEGAQALERVPQQSGMSSRYQRFKDGVLVTDAESFTIHEDTLDDHDVYRVEVERWDDAVGEIGQHTVFLDATTLRPLIVRHREAGSQTWSEISYERKEAVVTGGGSTSDTFKTKDDTVDFVTLQLLLLKFFEDVDRMRFSFLEDGSLYHFHASLKDVETVVLESGSYETLHLVCGMRGTWAHFSPKLHYWIEAAPPYRLVRFQVKREVVELIE